jgi:hypothetical protein
MVELLAKNACEPNLKARYLCLSRYLFLGGRGLHDSVQAGLKLDCQALELRKLRAWIRSLRPYPSLALFSVPVVILEPIKPVAAYLAATGQILSGALTLIIGEILKLVLVERLFSLTRDKLMKIPAFAWAYTKFRQARAWIEATEAWRAMRSLSKTARDYLTHVRATRGRRFANVKDRR